MNLRSSLLIASLAWVQAGWGQSVAVVGSSASFGSLTAEQQNAYGFVLDEYEGGYVSFADIGADAGALDGHDVLWWHEDGSLSLPSEALDEEVILRIQLFLESGGGLALSGFAPQYVVPLGYEDTPPTTVVRDPKPSGEWGFTQRVVSHPVFSGLPNPFVVMSANVGVDNNVCWWNDAGQFDGEWLGDTEWVGQLVTVGEYRPQSGRVIIIGTGAFEWDHPEENMNRDTLEEFTRNVIDHLASPPPAPTATLTPTPTPAPGDDIILADFEHSGWNGWTATGSAWGGGPVSGGPASNFLGARYAGSSHGGDGATGTLTSPAFLIERDFLRFLISGGSYLEKSGYGGQTRVNLLINGQVVRQAAGSSQTDRMDWLEWDVRDLHGETAQLELRDTATGSWGHLSVDHFVLSNQPLAEMRLLDRRYLNIPVRLTEEERVVDVVIDGLAVEEFRVNLGTPHNHDFHVFVDVGRHLGKRALVRVNARNSSDGALFPLSDQPLTGTPIYEESLRPVYHYTARRGFINDTNGMVYYDGEYHLCYQHNPYQLKVGNQVWGHAVSTDLVHWRELPTAITGDALGQVWSGSSAVDWQNSAGFGAEAIVSFYTSAAGYGNNNIMSAGQQFTQSLAFSLDRNRTYIKYGGNPVLGNQPPGDNRDPFVFWYEPDGKWVMLLWLRNHPSTFAFYSSTDLKNWTETSQFIFDGVIEVPMLFPLPLDGNTENMKWILWAGDAHYHVGQFDGERFQSESGPHWMPGATDSNFILAASQVFSDAPGGRRILMANDNSARNFPGMPFGKMLTFPVELSLRSRPNGTPWIYANPVEEISGLYLDTVQWQDVPLGQGNPLAGISARAYEIDATFEWGNATDITFDLGTARITYDVPNRMLRCTPSGSHTSSRIMNDFATQGDRLRLRILVDIGSVEVFGNDGYRYMTIAVPPVAADQPLSLQVEGNGAVLNHMVMHNLGSIWSEVDQSPEGFLIY